MRRTPSYQGDLKTLDIWATCLHNGFKLNKTRNYEMLTVNNNTKMNFILEALPLDAATRIGDIIADAIATHNFDWPNSWDAKKIGDLTLKEFEYFLVDMIDDLNTDADDEDEVRYEAFADILEKNTFRETIIV